MNLVEAYDPAKTAAQAGDEMALVSAYDPAKAAASATDLATLAGVADDIQAKTDLIPDDPATIAAVEAVEAKVDDILEDTGTTIPALIGALNIDQGATAKTYTVKDASGDPVPDARVEITTQVGGGGYLTTKWTNAFGQITVKLDPGTYYFWSSKAGKIFTNPDTEVVE